MKNFVKPLVSEKTDQGKIRESNEDRCLVIEDNSQGHPTDTMGILLAVADGMGGHLAGETASRMACEILETIYYEHEEPPSELLPSEILHQRLESAIHQANTAIYDHAELNPEYSGMGTTLTAVVLLPEVALIAHVGDSRIYRLRNHFFEQLSEDHTEVQALIDMGRLRPEKAATHPRRNILTQSVGVEPQIEEVFKKKTEIKTGDVLLLCSDGLYDMVSDEQIRQILMENKTPHEACDQLIAEALAAGGRDNVTVVVAKCLGMNA